MSLALCRYMELEEERADLELPEGELRILLVVSRPDPELSGQSAFPDAAKREQERHAIGRQDVRRTRAVAQATLPCDATVDARERGMREARSPLEAEGQAHHADDARHPPFHHCIPPSPTDVPNVIEPRHRRI